VAVQDLLTELRIAPAHLSLMAQGFAPSYAGAPAGLPVPTCLVQLSPVVARKLAAVIDVQVPPLAN